MTDCIKIDRFKLIEEQTQLRKKFVNLCKDLCLQYVKENPDLQKDLWICLTVRQLLLKGDSAIPIVKNKKHECRQEDGDRYCDTIENLLNQPVYDV